ncbi:hypothetical protein CW304_09480 [Bacillus sp. UFRGS-B20]|nr:hypothetical protein CW304_09480 [Bacillus sp. UFRGS-B20]
MKKHIYKHKFEQMADSYTIGKIIGRKRVKNECNYLCTVSNKTKKRKKTSLLRQKDELLHLLSAIK